MPRTLTLLIFGALTAPLPAAAGYWSAGEEPRQVPIEALLEAHVPAGSCWRISISESLRGKPVYAPPNAASWREALDASGRRSGFQVETDPDTCKLHVRPGSMPAATEVASAGAAPAIGGSADAVAYRGTGTATAVRSAGHDVQLGVALKSVLPPDWLGQASDPATMRLPMTWRADMLWDQAVKEFAQRHGLRVLIDWDRRIVAFEGTPRLQLAAPAAAGSGAAPQVAQSADPSMPAADHPAVRSTDMAPVTLAPAKVEPIAEVHNKPAPHFATLQEFLNERVKVDVTGATFEEVMHAMIPPSWDLDYRDVAPRVKGKVFDLTDVRNRGAMIHAFTRQLGFAAHPFVEFDKLIISLPKH